MLEDIAILTSGTVISEDLGIKLENVKLKTDLGKAKTILIERRRTLRSSRAPARRPTYRAGAGRSGAEIEETTSDYDKRKAAGAAGEARRRRGGNPRVGGSTEVEVKERKRSRR